MNKTIFFDVDDTLVRWLGDGNEPNEGDLSLTEEDVGTIIVTPIKSTIDFLIEQKEKGNTIVVWSQGGKDWVDLVVDALGIKDHVDVTIAKPDLYVDDLHCTTWLTSHWKQIEEDAK